MANPLDLFTKKLRASTWEDTKPLVEVIGHYPPTKGMAMEGQKAMIMVAIHTSIAQHQGRERVSLREPTVTWTRESLVEEEVAPEEEQLDPYAARTLFPAALASQS